ncbi:MAG: hypothetical protein ACTSU5_19180 [Promethearchaeota archaeon]
MLSDENHDPREEFTLVERTLGTPSAQDIFALLSCWGKLSARDLVDKTRLSESQVHATLRAIEGIGVVARVSRGIYSIARDKFAQQLKGAYLTRIDQSIGKSLYRLVKGLDHLPAQDLSRDLAILVKRWKPLLDQNYHHQVSTLVGALLEAK